MAPAFLGLWRYIMNDIENQVSNILAAFWYNNSDEDMRAICSEVKSRIARCFHSLAYPGRKGA